MFLAAAGNVEIPAYFLLVERGYQVSRVFTERVEWIAERGDVTLAASSPLELLGLASLAESRGDAWRASDDQTSAFLHDFPDESAR